MACFIMEEVQSKTKITDERLAQLKWLTRTAVLLALTLVAQMIGLPQPFTGPIVNSMLLLSGIFVGASSGILIGLITPWIAFMRGILAAPLGPMVPFIMAGNAVLVGVFTGVRLFNRGTNPIGKVAVSAFGLVLGAAAKFLILSSAVRFIVDVPPKVAQAMQTPQFVTAITGGIIALAVEGVLKMALFGKRKKNGSEQV